MSTSRSRRATGLAALASVGLIIALAGPAAAAEPAFRMDFAAGLRRAPASTCTSTGTGKDHRSFASSPVAEARRCTCSRAPGRR